MEELIDVHSRAGFPHGRHHHGHVRASARPTRTGRGRIVVRASTEIEQHECKTVERIIVTEIPYQVNKAALGRENRRARARKAHRGHLRPARRVRHVAGMRIVIELKQQRQCAGRFEPSVTSTPSFRTPSASIMLALVDGKPQILDLKADALSLSGASKGRSSSAARSTILKRPRRARTFSKACSSRLTTSMRSSPSSAASKTAAEAKRRT